MTEYFKQIITDQFDASLMMLGECVSKCPTEHWEGRIGKSSFWRVAYHTLYFVDMYLSVDEQSFAPPLFHRKGSQGLGDDMADKASSEVPYDKDTVTEYVNHCRAKVSEVIVLETQQSLEKRSGFPWYPMSRGEHHLASIRHVQHHVGQLSAYLRRNTGDGVDWIGKIQE